MNGPEFVEELDADIRQALERLGRLSAAGDVSEDLTVNKLLVIALKNELEATDIAAHWMTDTPEIDVRSFGLPFVTA